MSSHIICNRSIVFERQNKIVLSLLKRFTFRTLIHENETLMPIKVLYRKSCFYLFFSKWWAVVLLLRCIKTFCLDEDLKELFIYLSCNLFSSFNCVNLCQVRIGCHVQYGFKLLTQILCLKKKISLILMTRIKVNIVVVLISIEYQNWIYSYFSHFCGFIFWWIGEWGWGQSRLRAIGSTHHVT